MIKNVCVFFLQLGPPDGSLPPYVPRSVSSGSQGPTHLMTQGDRLNLLKRERVHPKSSTMRYVLVMTQFAGNWLSTWFVVWTILWLYCLHVLGSDVSLSTSCVSLPSGCHLPVFLLSPCCLVASMLLLCHFHVVSTLSLVCWCTSAFNDYKTPDSTWYWQTLHIGIWTCSVLNQGPLPMCDSICSDIYACLYLM